MLSLRPWRTSGGWASAWWMLRRRMWMRRGGKAGGNDARAVNHTKRMRGRARRPVRRSELRVAEPRTDMDRRGTGHKRVISRQILDSAVLCFYTSQEYHSFVTCSGDFRVRGCTQTHNAKTNGQPALTRCNYPMTIRNLPKIIRVEINNIP